MDAHTQVINQLYEVAQRSAEEAYQRILQATEEAAKEATAKAADEIVDELYEEVLATMAAANRTYAASCEAAQAAYTATCKAAYNVYRDNCARQDMTEDEAYQIYLEARFAAGAVFRKACSQAHELADSIVEQARETACSIERAVREEIGAAVERAVRQVTYENRLG